MQTDPWFEIREHHTFSGDRSWRLKGGHIRIRDRSNVESHVTKPITAPRERISYFLASLEFLDVWKWRNDYQPGECGYTVLDGLSWSFNGDIEGRTIRAGGENAYPSFADVRKASLEPERYGFLVFALHNAFGVPLPDDLVAEF